MIEYIMYTYTRLGLDMLKKSAAEMFDFTGSNEKTAKEDSSWVHGQTSRALR